MPNPVDYPSLIAQFGFSAVMLFFLVPRLEKLTRAIDRLTRAHLLSCASNDSLSEAMKQQVKNLEDELNTIKGDLK